jgi:hypothetical protein
MLDSLRKFSNKTVIIKGWNFHPLIIALVLYYPIAEWFSSSFKNVIKLNMILERTLRVTYWFN